MVHLLTAGTVGRKENEDMYMALSLSDTLLIRALLLVII